MFNFLKMTYCVGGGVVFEGVPSGLLAARAGAQGHCATPTVKINMINLIQFILHPFKEKYI